MTDEQEREAARQRLGKKIDELREQNRDLDIDIDEEELYRIIEEEVRAVRNEIYDEWIRSSTPETRSIERNEQ